VTEENKLITRPLFGTLLSRKSLFLGVNLLAGPENDVFRICGERKRHTCIFSDTTCIHTITLRPSLLCAAACWFIKTIPAVLAPCMVYRTVCHVLARNTQSNAFLLIVMLVATRSYQMFQVDKRSILL
jgi:hypothetical protein